MGDDRETTGASNEIEERQRRGTQALANIEQLLMESVGLPLSARLWMNEIDVIRKALD